MSRLFPLMIVCLVQFQVHAQDAKPVEGIINSGSMQSVQNEFKTMLLPVVNVSKEEIAAYEQNPANTPKMDFKPTGKKAQPKTAGTSYLKITKQIIGGSDAALTQFSWQIYMIADNSWLCGGSLIAANWVLTAAHCVKGARSIVVTVGGIQRTSVESFEKTQTSRSFVVHSKYNSRTLVNDMAVIKMPANFAMNTYVNVIRLPKQSDATNSFAGSNVTASGYGKTSNTGSSSSVMKFVQLSVITNSACAGVFGTTTVASTCICTAADPVKSICSGDSGGPLMYLDTDGKFIQVGVVSFGAAASCTSYPAGYSRVTSYLGWISSSTGIAIAR